MPVQSNAITFRMPFAIPGDLTRAAGHAIVKAEVVGATPFPAYGLPCIMAVNTVIPVATTGQSVYGFIVRPFPTQGVSASDPLGSAVPRATGIINVMIWGYIGVYVQVGAASVVEGGSVFVRVAAPVAGQIVAGIEGVTSANNYAISNANSGVNAYFTGPCDANGFTEIAFNV